MAAQVTKYRGQATVGSPQFLENRVNPPAYVAVGAESVPPLPRPAGFTRPRWPASIPLRAGGLPVVWTQSHHDDLIALWKDRQDGSSLRGWRRDIAVLLASSQGRLPSALFIPGVTCSNSSPFPANQKARFDAAVASAMAAVGGPSRVPVRPSSRVLTAVNLGALSVAGVAST